MSYLPLELVFPFEVFSIAEQDAALDRLAELDTVPRPVRRRRPKPVPTLALVKPWERPWPDVIESHPVPAHAGGCWVSQLNRVTPDILIAVIAPCLVFQGGGYQHVLCPRCKAHIDAQTVELARIRAERQRWRREREAELAERRARKGQSA